MKKNKKGFALIEILIVSVFVMIAFVAVYVNFYPLIGNYEQRLLYNDIESKYSLFNIKKIYLNVDNESRFAIRDYFSTATNYYLDLLDDNGLCKRDYLASEEDGKYCDALVKELEVEELIVSPYNTVSLKANYNDNADLKKYINYLPKNINSDSALYRIIVKTTKGYATSKFDVDLLQYEVTLTDTSLTMYTAEKAVIGITIKNTSVSQNKVYYSLYQCSNTENCGDINVSVRLLQANSLNTGVNYGEETSFILEVINQQETGGFDTTTTVSLNGLFKIGVGLSASTATIDDTDYTKLTTYELTNNVIRYEFFKEGQTYNVGADGYYQIELQGAGGGSNVNCTSCTTGSGYKTTARVYLEKGRKLYVYVGEQGSQRSETTDTIFNGGGLGGLVTTNSAYNGYSGGGATDIRLVNGSWDDTTSLDSRIMVAGGGGGYYSSTNLTSYSNTSIAGGLSGDKGYTYSDLVNASGNGGTQSSGGTGGVIYTCSSYIANAGSKGIGGNAQVHATTGINDCDLNTAYVTPSGGGGGYYGGGAGGFTKYSSGGGGGSSYISGVTGFDNHSSYYLFTNATLSVATSKLGYATITYLGTTQ